MITRALYKVLESPTLLLFSIMDAILNSQTIVKFPLSLQCQKTFPMGRKVSVDFLPSVR